MFPPDMTGQRPSSRQALDWVLGEFVAQRAEEPVAFLAQLGRDHRKYGVTDEHYEALAHALLRHPARRPGRRCGPRAVDEAARAGRSTSSPA